FEHDDTACLWDRNCQVRDWPNVFNFHYAHSFTPLLEPDCQLRNISNGRTPRPVPVYTAPSLNSLPSGAASSRSISALSRAIASAPSFAESVFCSGSSLGFLLPVTSSSDLDLTLAPLV